MLEGLDNVQLTVMRTQRAQAVHDAAQDELATLPTMKVPKLTSTNYETFNTAFTAVATRTMGTNGTTLDYLKGMTPKDAKPAPKKAAHISPSGADINLPLSFSLFHIAPALFLASFTWNAKFSKAV
jgi:hypothetical protein